MLEKIDGNMPIYAKLQRNRNGLKAGKYEVFEYDQGAIRLPRQWSVVHNIIANNA